MSKFALLLMALLAATNAVATVQEGARATYVRTYFVCDARPPELPLSVIVSAQIARRSIAAEQVS